VGLAFESEPNAESTRLELVSPLLSRRRPVDGMYNCAWAVLGEGLRDVNKDLSRGKTLCQDPLVVDFHVGSVSNRLRRVVAIWSKHWFLWYSGIPAREKKEHDEVTRLEARNQG
jgi:hypothetical protein